MSPGEGVMERSTVSLRERAREMKLLALDMQMAGGNAGGMLRELSDRDEISLDYVEHLRNSLLERLNEFHTRLGGL